MINTYSEYIDSFITLPRKESRPIPGEHHFVSTYLLERVTQLTKRVPDYVNPDGTKNIIGDIVYYKNKRHQFGIEVKLGTIRFTKNEFNSWIASNSDKTYWPDLFLGVGSRGVILLEWSDFRQKYIQSVNEKVKDWHPQPIKSGYGPQKTIDGFFSEDNENKSGFFTSQKNDSAALSSEKEFVKSLKKLLDNNCAEIS